MTAPCLGTPADIERIIDAGYGAMLEPTVWGAGMVMGWMDRPLTMLAQRFNEEYGCIFLEEGKCLLHDKGLKPTEGRLSHHSHGLDNFVKEKSISWNVAKEWGDPKNLETMRRISRKYELSLALVSALMKEEKAIKNKKQ